MTSLDNVDDDCGMKVTIKKTKVMKISKKAENDMNILFLKNQAVEQDDHFKYLKARYQQMIKVLRRRGKE